jgi:DNA-directed RNA polymerase subunit RPC12/RpoP
MNRTDYFCPICRASLDYYSRYPNYVCSRCLEKVTDEKGRGLSFFNEGMYGGFKAVYTDNDEKRDSRTCYIDGVKCFADEAYMGGIVVQVNS